MKYKNTLELDLNVVSWDEKLWKMFCKTLKREYRSIEFVTMGVVRLYFKNEKITTFQLQAFVKSVLSDFLDKNRPIHLQMDDDKTEKLLPLAKEPESVTYLFYSTRLSILQTNTMAAEWLRQYFMDIRLFYHKHYINYFFFEEEIEQILCLSGISYQDVELKGGIYACIKSYLNRGEYINVHLDEYYLSAKDYYNRRHYVHENLIYGYNDFKQEFYAYGFGKRQQSMRFIITYEELLLAYEKGKLFYFCGAEYLENQDYFPVLVSHINKIAPYEFTESDMRNKLHAFLNPKPDEMVGEDVHVYGSNVYSWIIQELMGKTNYGTVDFRVFQLLYEHKKCVYHRMCYLKESRKLSKRMRECLPQYEKILNKFQQIRFLYLKELQTERKFDSINKCIGNAEVNKLLAQKLIEAAEYEKTILRKLLEV